MEGENENTTQDQEKPKSNNLLIVGVGVLAFVVLGGAVFILNRPSNKQNNQLPSVEKFSEESLNPTPSPSNQASEGAALEEDVFTISVQGGNYFFKPNEIRVKNGQKVVITFQSQGGMHDFVLEEFDVQSKTLKSGESTQIEFVTDRIGTFEFYCSIANHRAMGMKGTLIVE